MERWAEADHTGCCRSCLVFKDELETNEGLHFSVETGLESPKV